MATRSDKQWFMDLRAEALATVFLTGRPDIQIDKRVDDRGIDFLVHVANPRSGSKDRLFAVQVKVADDTSDRAPLLPANLRRVLTANFIESTIPVCLFYFTMQDERAWWQWIMAPAAENDADRLRLTPIQDSDLRPLDESEVSRIVDEVNRWYDARREATLAFAA